MLLTREQFRTKCLNRDKNQCVICCSQSNLSVHHIIERKLWPDGGYYLDNGATLCDICHLEAEKTTLSCDAIRQAANISEIILPGKLCSYLNYDKWGNIMLLSGLRIPGELFFEKSVQFILAQGEVLGLFIIIFHKFW